MYLKKKGAVLISTMIILALVLTIGSFMFSNMRNNNELSSVYEFDGAICNLNKNEEEALYKCMKKLNEEYKEKQSNQEDISIEKLLSKSIKEDGYFLSYDEKKKKFILINDNTTPKMEREILCTVKKERLILIPTCKFGENKKTNNGKVGFVYKENS